MTFLRVDSSIRDEDSVSRELTDAVEQAWLAADPDAEVVHLDLAATPARLETWQLATYEGFLPPDLRTQAMREARAAVCRAADEVLAADAITVGAPLYNFGVPAALKSWIDLLITDPRFDPRHTPLGRSLAGVPLTLVIARGGGYGPGSPREGWDHSTPYLERIFGDVFGAEVTLIIAELTAADTDPAMAALRLPAARSRADALARARATAAEHAGRTPALTARRAPDGDGWR